MAVSPICEVREGAGPFQPTADGINITPGATVSIRLVSTTDVSDWYLYIAGTDETTTPPVLTGVNPMTQKVTTPSTVVTFTMPSGAGKSLLFNSTTEGVGGPVAETFGLYTLSAGGRRVGSTGEMREGSTAHGWVYLVNPIIRSGASVIWYDDTLVSPSTGASNVQGAIDALKGGGASITLGGDLGDWTPASSDKQKVVGLQARPFTNDPYNARVVPVPSTNRYPTSGFVESVPAGDDIWWAFDYTGAIKYDFGAGYTAINFPVAPGANPVSPILVGSSVWCGIGASVRRFQKADLALEATLPTTGLDSVLAYDSDRDRIWVLTKLSGSGGMDLQCIDPATNTVTYSTHLASTGSSYSGTVGLIYGASYVWFTDNTGNAYRILPQAPWTLTTIPTLTAHPGHVPGNVYSQTRLLIVDGTDPKLCFVAGLRSGTFPLGEHAWILRVDVNTTTCDIATRYVLDFFNVSYPDETPGLLYLQDLLWLAASTTANALNRYVGFIRFRNVFGDNLEHVDSIPTANTDPDYALYVDDDFPTYYRIFTAPVLQAQYGAGSDNYIAWWGRGSAGMPRETLNVFTVSDYYFGDMWDAPYSDQINWIPASVLVPPYQEASDLAGTVERGIVGRIRGALAPVPTDLDVGKVLALDTSKPTWVSPRAIVTDNTYVYVAESGQSGAGSATGIVRKFHVEWQDDGTHQYRDTPVLNLVAEVDLSATLGTVDRVRDLAQDDTYLYAACWDSYNIAIIRKSDMTIVGWGWMNDGMGTDWRAISVCADQKGHFFCYSSQGPNPVARFLISACLGQPPSTVLPEATFTGSRGRWIRYFEGYVWQSDGGNAGFGIRKIDPVTMTEIIANNPISPAPSYMEMLFYLDNLWVTYNSFSGVHGVARLDPADLSLIADIPVAGADTLNEMCVHPEGGMIAVVDQGTNEISIVYTEDNSVMSSAMLSTPSNIDGIVAIDQRGESTTQQNTSLVRATFLLTALDTSGSPGIYKGLNGGLGTVIYGPVAYRFKLTYTNASGFVAGGDLLAASPTSQTVVGLQGRALAATAPSGGQVVTWNAGSSQWEPQTPSAGGGGSGSPYFYHRIGSYLAQEYNFYSNPPTVGQAMRVASNTTRPMGMFYDSRYAFGNTPNGPIVWIGRQNTGDVFWFDTYYWMFKTIPLTTQGASAPNYGLLPRHVVRDAVNSMIWVAGDRTIQKIDQITEEVKLTITLGSSSNAVWGLAVDSVNNRIIGAPSSSSGLARIYLIDATTGALTSQNIPGIPSSPWPHCYGIYLYGGFLYWFGSTTVYRLDPLTYTLLGSAAYGTTMGGEKRIVEYGGYLFFTSPGFANLYRLDTGAMTVASLALTGGAAQGLCLDTYTPAIWVATTTTRGFNKVITPTGAMTNSTFVTVAGTDTPYDCIYDPLYTYVYGVCDGTSTTGAYLCSWRPYGASQSLLLGMNGGLEWFSPVGIGGDLSGTGTSPTVAKIRNVSVSTTSPTNGQHLVYNSSLTQWEPTTVSSGNPLLLTGVANPTGLIAHIGQLVGLRNINGTLTAVALQQYDMEQYNVNYSSVSLPMTTVDAGITATAGPYALDACALTGALDNYVGASQAVQIAVVYASSTSLMIRRLGYTGSGWTVNAAASVALTGAATYISVCSYSTTIAYLAYVDSGTGTGYMLRVDMSTTPPTLGTPAAFNDMGGTIDGVSVYINWNTSGGVVEQGPFVVWGLSGTTAVYTRMTRQSAGVLSFSTPSGVSVNAAVSTVNPHGTFSMWGGGSFLEMSGVMGEGGRWGFNAAGNNGFWPGVQYPARSRVPRIDGPDISGTSPSYLVDVAVTGRPGTGCWLDSNLHVGLVWGSKAGYSDGTYAWVVDRRFGDWTARRPVLLDSTAGDLVDSSTYPAPKLRATTCRRITDRSFAFGGFQQNASDSTLCFGVGYVKDGYVHTGYYNHPLYYMYAPAGGSGSFNIADDRQRAVPVKLRDDRFAVISIARPFSSGATPQLYVSPAMPIADVHQAVGVAYTATDPMTVLTYGAVVTTTYSGTMGEWCYGLNPDLTTFSISYGGGTRPEYENRLGLFISTTQMLIVPTKSG